MPVHGINVTDRSFDATPLAWETNIKFWEELHRIISGHAHNMVHASDFTFYKEVDQLVQEEPNEALDPETLGLLAAIGIEKGKPFAPAAHAAHAAELAKAAQNPIADMVSLPLQNNTNFEFGPQEKTQNVLNIQPVYPVDLDAEWSLITRTIVPVISQPEFVADQGRENGIDDIQFSAFFSPKKPTAGGWIWGADVIAQLDTATDDCLGQGAWGLGPTAVALRIDGPWVYGALINNVWSVSKDDNRQNVNQMLIQPFTNYNFPTIPGRYLTFAPIITADWEANGGNRWTVPLGLGIGQIMRWGQQPVNLQASAYYNVERPDFGAPIGSCGCRRNSCFRNDRRG